MDALHRTATPSQSQLMPMPTLTPPASRTTTAPAPSAPARTPVFIVDDSPVVRDRLVHLLDDVPQVEVVGQADIAFEAIQSIRRLRPRVVVLDISMPGGSGIYVLETLAKESPRPTVIMLTNFANDQYRRKCLQLGADFFFDKSCEFEKVPEVLRHLPDAATRDQRRAA